MSIDKWDECFIGINSIELNFEDFIKKKLRFTYFFLFMLTRGCIFITREINRVCLCSILHLFLFTLFLILFLILFRHYKPSSTLFEIPKPPSIIFKLCIFVTAFYLDSILSLTNSLATSFIHHMIFLLCCCLSRY